MAITRFPNGVSSFGTPLYGNGIPATSGSIFFVDYGNGSDGVSTKANSMSRPWKTVDKAYDSTTTNKDDVIVLMGNSTHTLTEMLDVSKNRIHFVGLDCTARKYGQNAKVSLGVTTAATDIATIKNTGTRNTFTNIKFMNSNTVAEGIYCFAEGGEYTVISNCELYKDTDLDVTGAAELLMNGDSVSVIDCTIGSLVNAISGAILRPCVLVSRETITGKVCRDVTFTGCNFWRKCGDTGNRFVYGANATDVERMLLFDRCLFVNAKLASAVPAQNVAFGATQTEGEVLLWNCSSMNAATAMSTTTGVFVDSPVPTAGTSGISVQAS